MAPVPSTLTMGPVQPTALEDARQRGSQGPGLRLWATPSALAPAPRRMRAVAEIRGPAAARRQPGVLPRLRRLAHPATTPQDGATHRVLQGSTPPHRVPASVVPPAAWTLPLLEAPTLPPHLEPGLPRRQAAGKAAGAQTRRLHLRPARRHREQEDTTVRRRRERTQPRRLLVRHTRTMTRWLLRLEKGTTEMYAVDWEVA